MIVVDGRDHAELGSHHVGGIQSAAQAHFQHHGVQLGIGESHESHGGDGFEIRGVHVELARGEHPFGGFVNPRECARRIAPG